ncbi:carboxymuconolactone decarboxylase family protein [Desulfobacterales bacterium HSG17]|nr:carboxymuconolactone decarboxylase family protein [Desulfobacterales bacterium HSG17]
MYLPEKYQNFMSAYPEIFESYKDLGKKIRTSGPLDEKIQDLVKLGIAVGSNSRGAVMSHTRKAVASGSTKEEINHAILLALSTTGFPNMIAALHWAGEVFDKTGE